jgi:hypothetical protein
LKKTKSTFLGVNSMSTIQHSAVTGADLHGIVAYSVGTTTNRDALTGIVAGDIGKVCQVTADNSFYVLTSVGPNVWTAIAPAAVTWSTLSGKPTLATVATTGAYADLTGAPAAVTWSTLSGTPTLATVATTGAYADLTGTPSIPAAGASLTAANTWSAGQRGAVATLTYAATITPNFAASNNFSLTATGNFILAFPTNVVAGQSGIIAITQDATGSRVITFASGYVAAGAVKPTLTTTANAVDYISYYVETTGRVFVSITSAVA